MRINCGAFLLTPISVHTLYYDFWVSGQSRTLQDELHTKTGQLSHGQCLYIWAAVAIDAFALLRLSFCFNAMLLKACFWCAALHCELHCVLCCRDIDLDKALLAMTLTMMILLKMMMTMIVFDYQYFCEHSLYLELYTLLAANCRIRIVDCEWSFLLMMPCSNWKGKWALSVNTPPPFYPPFFSPCSLLSQSTWEFSAPAEIIYTHCIPAKPRLVFVCFALPFVHPFFL